MHRAHEQCGHRAGWRGLTVGDVGITRRLSETYSADYLTCPQDSPGVFSLLRGLRPRARWRGHPDGADARAVRPYSGGEGGAGRASRGIGQAGHTGGRTAFGRGCIRVLSSRATAGYAQLGISLGAVARQCLCIAAFPGCVSCSQCSLCCISALGRGVAPAMPVAGRADALAVCPFGF